MVDFGNISLVANDAKTLSKTINIPNGYEALNIMSYIATGDSYVVFRYASITGNTVSAGVVNLRNAPTVATPSVNVLLAKTTIK